MKSPLLYIIESLICSGLFLIVYQTLIAYATSFPVRRRFLLVSVQAACLIPLLQIPVLSSKAPMVYYAQTTGQASEMTAYVGLIIYLAGAFVLSISALMQLWRVRNICKHSEQKAVDDGTTIITSTQVRSPFSFLHTVYLPPIDNDSDRQHILAHEQSHIRHHHSWERMLMEALKIVFWFNPFVWLYANRLVEVQEQEADNEALSNGFQINDYRATLLKYLFGIHLDVVNCMAKHLLANRFNAMTEHHKNQNGRAWLLVPMLLLSVMVFALTPKPPTAPIIIVDGKVTDSFDNIPPEQIKAMTIIKDKKSIEEHERQYGEQARNGIIKIELIK